MCIRDRTYVRTGDSQVRTCVAMGDGKCRSISREILRLKNGTDRAAADGGGEGEGGVRVRTNTSGRQDTQKYVSVRRKENRGTLKFHF